MVDSKAGWSWRGVERKRPEDLVHCLHGDVFRRREGMDLRACGRELFWVQFFEFVLSALVLRKDSAVYEACASFAVEALTAQGLGSSPPVFRFLWLGHLLADFVINIFPQGGPFPRQSARQSVECVSGSLCLVLFSTTGRCKESGFGEH